MWYWYIVIALISFYLGILYNDKKIKSNLKKFDDVKWDALKNWVKRSE